MSADLRSATATVPTPTPAPSLTPTVRSSSRRAAFWVVAAIGALSVALITMLINGTMSTGGPELGRNNPAPAGAMAVAEVLSQQGVTVVTANTLTDALDLTAEAHSADAGATLFVADLTGLLTTAQVAQLDGVATHTVVVAPHFDILQALTPEIGFGGVSADGPLEATDSCSNAAAQRAGTVGGLDGAGLNTLSIPEDATGYSGCFGDSVNADDSSTTSRSFVLVQRDQGVAAERSQLSLVADPAIFANASVIEEGNAALALGLLGENSTLVWYQPSLADVDATGSPTLAELSPGWVTPLMVLLVLVGIAASIAYGRRFGALVVENLPVTVRASETMEGRARLYSRNSTRLHAVDSLRLGTVSRLAAKLGLSRTSTVEEVVAAAASVTGHDPRSVRDTLIDGQPSNDADMLRISDQLLALEQSVDHAVNPNIGHTPYPTERMEP